jgi:hypothetical protein
VRKPPRKQRVLGVLTSDWHLWHKPPVARSAEPDWWSAMTRPLREIRSLMTLHQCPLVFAGDLFDKYDPTPEMLNFTLDELPYPCFGIPGQHDLQNHRLDNIKRSGYWTLVKSGRIRHLAQGEVTGTNELLLFGFPWGESVTPCPEQHLLETRVKLAVIHKYVWREGHGYTGASEESRVYRSVKALKGYHAAVYGDNHSGFLTGFTNSRRRLAVLNAGTLLRRKQDERDYRPCVGLLHADGSISRHIFDCSADVFLDAPGQKKKSELEAKELLEELAKLGDAGISFRESVLRHLNDNSTEECVRDAVLKALG